jgi:hypothetical protein
MTRNQRPDRDANEREADKILDRVAQDSESVGTSSMRRVAERVSGHLGAADADQDKFSEVWGTRIGRSLGMVFVVFLIGYLIKTYVLNG